MSATQSALEAAFPDPARVAETRRVLEEAGVEFVLSCWIDLLGVPKTKPVPLSELEQLCRGKGPQFAVHSVSMAPDLGPADPDQIMLPDLDSLTLCPWDARYAFVFADLYFEGEPYAVCPRSALKRAVRQAEAAGYRVLAGIEPEFIAMRYDEDDRPVKAYDDLQGADLRRQAFGYDVEFSLDSMPFLGDLAAALDQLDWKLTNLVAEGAYSQFELDFGHADVLTTADRLTFLRVMLKEIAKRHGMFVTFMPKPTQGDWRSGAHINHSLVPVDGDENLFKAPDGEWSGTAMQSVAGLLRHARAMTAVTCPTVNSYKGLIARARGFEGGTVTWAPTHATYGLNNRSAMLRLPQARFAIENRAADMCMNAYLGLALTVTASLEGIAEQADPGPALNAALYELGEDELRDRGAERLPTNLLEAITAFDADPLAKATLGPTMHNSYSVYKHDEWDRFHEHVTGWETREYLRFF
jgi:glutamine synthetase